MTYLRAYVLVPALCAWPLGVLLLASAVRRLLGAEPGSRLPQSWITAFVLVFATNLLVVLLCAARRMRGFPGRGAAVGAADTSTARKAG